MKNICIFGTGGFSKECLWLLEELNYHIDCFIDTIEKDNHCGYVVRSENYFDATKHLAVIAVGNPDVREKIIKKLPPETEFPNIISKSAQIGKTVKMGKGNIICANVVITADVTLGNHIHFNLNSTCGHDSIIGDFTTVSPGVNISGNTHLNKRVFMGTNSCTVENVSIVDDSIIGAGAVVSGNITEAGTYVGVPAKKIK